MNKREILFNKVEEQLLEFPDVDADAKEVFKRAVAAYGLDEEKVMDFTNSVIIRGQIEDLIF